MALTDLWLSSPDQLRDKQVHQIIAFAGDGRLRDGNRSSAEFRDFLSRLPSDFLARYAGECLASSFNESGQALQDIVNQVGRRLGFEVTHGRYRGTPNHVGFDGLWRSPSAHALVVEVKTTDAFRITLNTIAEYRRALITQTQIAEAQSSILIVVGRQDTGDLEAQIRGSRHAWDIRLISIDSLVRLVAVKESLEDPEVLNRIHQILIPREFTRLDDIVDILFSTAEDLKQDADEGLAEDPEAEKKFTPVAFHRLCVDRIAQALEVSFVKQSRASFHTPQDDQRLVCAISREHTRGGRPGYWFAFHPHQQAFLRGANAAFVAFGCGSPDRLLLIPFAAFEPLLEGLNVTEKESRTYWHVQIAASGGRYKLMRRKGYDSVDFTKYLLRSI